MSLHPTILLALLLAASATASAAGSKKPPRASPEPDDLELVAPPDLEEIKATPPAPAAPAVQAPEVVVAPADAGFLEAPARSTLEVGVLLAGGRIGSSSDDDASAYGRLELSVAGEPTDHLQLGFAFAEQIHDRRYLTTLPGENGGGSRRVALHERVAEARFSLGYDVGARLAGSDRAGLMPFLALAPGRFSNDLAPQNVLGAGGGLAGFLRAGEKLRLGARVSYEYNLLALVKGPALDAIDATLATGHQLGTLRWGVDASWSLTPGARCVLAYRSEWLAEERASRASDGLALGFVVVL